MSSESIKPSMPSIVISDSNNQNNKAKSKHNKPDDQEDSKNGAISPRKKDILTSSDELIKSSLIFNLANSLLILRKKPQNDQKPSGGNSFSAQNIPFCLFPSPFPRKLFLKAQRLQTIYNKLYVHISSRSDLIDFVVGKMVSEGTDDNFTEGLYKIWKKLEEEKKRNSEVGGRLGLGIFRSDYLLHQPESAEKSKDARDESYGLEIKQVEFNTVSVSFAALATKVSALHRYLTGMTSLYTREQLPRPVNQATLNLCKGLELGHRAYQSRYSPSLPTIVLMIVQPEERNIFDQTLLIYELDNQSSASASDRTRMVRLPCDRILEMTKLDEKSMQLYYLIDGVESFEVSVVYFRSMYGPEDFKTDDSWDGRYRLERSRAVKCPNVSLQLSGCKKFQQVLTDPNFVRDHLQLDRAGLEEDEFEALRSTWMEILEFDLGRSSEAYRLAADPKSSIGYVLKPQREGGGNNVYGAAIPDRLKGLKSENDLKSFILMSLIRTPTGIRNYLIRASDDGSHPSPEPSEIISELGIYGVCLFSVKFGGRSSDSVEVVENFEAGHVLRTKDAKSDEGGVAIGISCLDSPLLL